MNFVISNSPFRVSYLAIKGGKAQYFCIVGKEKPRGTDGHLKNRFHQHESYELIYVLNGELTQHLENGVFPYRAGDVCFLDRNTRHFEGYETDCSLVFLNFAPWFLEKLFGPNEILPDTAQFSSGIVREFLIGNAKEPKKEYLDFAYSPKGRELLPSPLTALLDEIILGLLYPKIGFAFHIQESLLCLIATLEDANLYNASRISLDSGTETFIMARINGYIQRYHGQISRKELSEYLHYNGDYLNRIAKRQTGTTLSKLCQNACLAEAKRLLLQTDWSISRIIEHLGYVNRTYFYEIFEKQFGVSPSEFRKVDSDTTHPTF
ncbi:MAG: helix-turn-helix domain-containing protein [Eubacteriales bacterium]|nr:helix-turn-helix domain-containing protein [Eubacteriales bacterium]